VQVDCIETRVEGAYGACIQRLKLKHDEPLENFAFYLNMRRYTEVDRVNRLEHFHQRTANKVHDGWNA